MNKEFNLSKKTISVMKIESLLWSEPYGSTKMLEANPFCKEKFIYIKDAKEFIRLIKEEFGKKGIFQFDVSKFNQEQKEMIEAMLKVINDFDIGWLKKIDKLSGDKFVNAVTDEKEKDE